MAALTTQAPTTEAETATTQAPTTAAKAETATTQAPTTAAEEETATTQAPTTTAKEKAVTTKEAATRKQVTKPVITTSELLDLQYSLILKGIPENVPVCVAAAEELYIQLSRFLHSCIGQAST